MAEMGKVASLWRYPVKSMQGEELSEGEVTQYGLLGDRVYALVDAAEGKAVSAKNPVRWPMVLGCKALFAEPPKKGAAPPAVRITLQDGSTTESTARDRASGTAARRKTALIRASMSRMLNGLVT